ncbi:hypothetical protein L1887_56908 [Cichorium endivia]|nr:hypothetical protein L1887_56908 [Cichorium endivia]
MTSSTSCRIWRCWASMESDLLAADVALGQREHAKVARELPRFLVSDTQLGESALHRLPVARRHRPSLAHLVAALELLLCHLFLALGAIHRRVSGLLAGDAAHARASAGAVEIADFVLPANAAGGHARGLELEVQVGACHHGGRAALVQQPVLELRCHIGGVRWGTTGSRYDLMTKDSGFEWRSVKDLIHRPAHRVPLSLAGPVWTHLSAQAQSSFRRQRARALAASESWKGASYELRTTVQREAEIKRRLVISVVRTRVRAQGCRYHTDFAHVFILKTSMFRWGHCLDDQESMPSAV